MDRLDSLGVGDDQVIIAPGCPLTPELFCGEVLFLQVGSHRAVIDEHAFFQGV